MKKLWKVLLILACIIPSIALAQDEGGDEEAPVKKKKKKNKESVHEMFTGQGYGVAGCGIGSIVFGPKPGMVQVVAATLNGTAGSQTFGITTGTSNCDIPEMGQQAAIFIETNQETLRKEAARGTGETVEGLAYLLKCSDTSAFGAKLRDSFPQVMDESADSYEKVRRILNLIKSDSELQKSCVVIG